MLSLMNLKISKNQIYIVADDDNQYELHKTYSGLYNIKLIILKSKVQASHLVLKLSVQPELITDIVPD